ncbi:MAG: bifunctional adenosylcobinamide kinase/adenosylcobinamide-phosphate guanylyltransferase [Clostridia bacterium]|nr:bifunctional adenosylcobinamide kinase/adenosylcobinamide-phosphate guanylyltransferase [Clostridia bacterium]
MKLYIGGTGQGQLELASAENPNAELFPDFHLYIRSLMNNGEDISTTLQAFCRNHPDAVIVSDEIGCGLVPMDPREREWRQVTGRALCMIAGESDLVTRVICGIGQRIK